MPKPSGNKYSLRNREKLSIKPTGKIPSSIDQVKEKLKKPVKAAEEQLGNQQRTPSQRQTLAQPFDLSDVQKHWAEAIPALLDENSEPVFRIILEECELEVRENHVIVVKVRNKVLTDRFKSFIPLLFKHLSKRLNNEKIELMAETAHIGQSKLKPYTAQEKFSFLAEKNPVLQKLRQKLDLDFN